MSAIFQHLKAEVKGRAAKPAQAAAVQRVRRSAPPKQKPQPLVDPAGQLV